MIDGPAYTDHVRRAAERIAAVAPTCMDTTVPSCPDMTVRELVGHTAQFSHWVATIVETGEPARPGQLELGEDVIAAHTQATTSLVTALSVADAAAPMWSWGTDQHYRFWFRRAAQELTVHRWDVENAAGAPSPIDASLAADGVCELIEEFGPDNPFFKGAGSKFGGDGETLRLESTDTSDSWTIIARPTTFEVATDATPDVVARACASDLLLFVWGRIAPDSIDVTGDSSLLARWRENVKI